MSHTLTPSKKISGFMYRSVVDVEHKYISIHKSGKEDYFVEMDGYCSKRRYNDIGDIASMWECIKEIEQNILASREII